MKNVMITALFFILSGVYPFYAIAEVSTEHQTEIKYLKLYVTKSTCVFVRNGIEYKGSEAVTHIIRKEEYFKERIVTTEDFIRLAATKSEISGKNYTVTCVEGNVESLGEWLQRELISSRNKKPGM